MSATGLARGSAPESTSPAQRIAGAVLLGNGVLVAYERIALSGSIRFDSVLESPASSVIDALLGVALLLGVRSVLGFVIFRAVAGALLLGGLHVSQGDPFMAGLQVAFSATLLALLVGNAGVVRTAFASLLAAGFLVLEITGIQMLSTGRVPSESLLAAQYDLEELRSASFESQVAPFRLQTPGPGWSRRSDASARADNPLADIWLVRPEYDAHILVVAESLPAGEEFDLDAVLGAVEANARSSAQDFQVHDRGHVAAIHTLGTTLDATASVDSLHMRFRYGIFVEGPHAVQVICFALPRSFEAIAADCDATLASFEFLLPRGTARMARATHAADAHRG